MDRPSKDQITGSTLAPNYPKVVVKKPKNLNGPFYFNDVAAIRLIVIDNKFQNKYVKVTIIC